jgi:predicted permease
LNLKGDWTGGIALLSRLLGDIGQELRGALRRLARSRAFTLIALLSLAVGIGVNTALFTVVHATWLDPVPGVGEADGIVEVLTTRRGSDVELWAYPDFQDVREAETPIGALAGLKRRDGNVTTEDGTQAVRVMCVSANYFEVMGVVPSRGRPFLPSEDLVPGGHPVAVVSHAMWQSRLGGREDIVGLTITLNQTPYTVVGVAPEAFRGHRTFSSTDLWVPITQHPFMAGPNSLERDRVSLWLEVLGRLRADATVDEANAALQTVFAWLAQEYPESNEDRGARAAAFGPVPAHGRGESMIATGALLALAGLVLLIICGNVAGMVLARSATREREIAVRLALGSGRGRLVRHLMAEALPLALVGGSLGMLLAFWATGTLSPAYFSDMPNLSLEPNLTILAFSLLVTLGTTLVFGLFPALRFSKPDMISSLKDDTGGGGRRVGRVHRVATSAQAGVALSLIVTCSLFVRALGVMERRDLGFEPHDLMLTRIDLSQQGYSTAEAGEAVLNRMRESVATVPAVTSVTVADGIPLDLVGNFTSVTRADQSDEAGGRVTVEFTLVDDAYFETIGTPILRGRGIERTDEASSAPVVVITQALADRLWPGEEAVGRQLRFSARFHRIFTQRDSVSGDSARAFTVVGVVGHVASSRATEDWPHVFVSLRQNYRPRVMLVVRGTASPAALARSVQSAILAVDPTLPFPLIVSSESLVARSTEAQRRTAEMAAGLGLLALLLSAIGVYGVVAFAVARRTREIGLRMAIGATRAQVLGAVLRDAVRLTAPGLAVGAVLAVATAAAARSMLLGVSPVDPISLGSAAGVLLLVVTLASLVPAQRASGIDPMVALRSE